MLIPLIGVGTSTLMVGRVTPWVEDSGPHKVKIVTRESAFTHHFLFPDWTTCASTSPACCPDFPTAADCTVICEPKEPSPLACLSRSYLITAVGKITNEYYTYILSKQLKSMSNSYLLFK